MEKCVLGGVCQRVCCQHSSRFYQVISLISRLGLVIVVVFNLVISIYRATRSGYCNNILSSLPLTYFLFPNTRPIILITYHGRIYASQYSLPQKFHLQVFITPHNMLIIPGSTSKDKCFWKINNIVVKIWESQCINKYKELKPTYHFIISSSVAVEAMINA